MRNPSPFLIIKKKQSTLKLKMIKLKHESHIPEIPNAKFCRKRVSKSGFRFRGWHERRRRWNNLCLGFHSVFVWKVQTNKQKQLIRLLLLLLLWWLFGLEQYSSWMGLEVFIRRAIKILLLASTRHTVSLIGLFENFSLSARADSATRNQDLHD